MYKRILELPQDKSFFLFGARNTGKSTLIETAFPRSKHLWIDLLDPRVEAQFAKAPEVLIEMVEGLEQTATHVIIDEVQKNPKLLDIVHYLMRDKKHHFVMTSSSARKLKAGGANLLAGRAYVFHLYPLSYLELKSDFSLDVALGYGTLPQITTSKTPEDHKEFLNAYAQFYLKEEIWGEHLIRQLDPFRRFLEVAAQCNGKLINVSKIARDCKVSDKTVNAYFGILEDTLIGFFLEPYHHSLRKRMKGQPKFYFFDTGIRRVLAGELDIPLQKSSHSYGNAFEHFIITEFVRIASYWRLNYKFSFAQTDSHYEIDLVVDRPGKSTLFIEIKSTEHLEARMLKGCIALTKDIKNAEVLCLSNDVYDKKIEHVKAMHWQKGLQYIFGNKPQTEPSRVYNC